MSKIVIPHDNAIELNPGRIPVTVMLIFIVILNFQKLHQPLAVAVYPNMDSDNWHRSWDVRVCEGPRNAHSGDMYKPEE